MAALRETIKIKESLNKSFDRLSATASALPSHREVVNAGNAGAFFRLPPASLQSRTNGKGLIPFVVSLSNHELNQLVQSLLNAKKGG